MDELLTRQQAAEALGISVSTLDVERMAGRLAYIQRKRNGRVWISQKAIQDYLSRGVHKALPQLPVRDTYRKQRA